MENNNFFIKIGGKFWNTNDISGRAIDAERVAFVNGEEDTNLDVVINEMNKIIDNEKGIVNVEVISAN